MMKSKAITVAVILAMVVVAFVASESGKDISEVVGGAALQVSSAAGAVWGFSDEVNTEFTVFIRLLISWVILIVIAIWGVIGSVMVYRAEPFPSLVVCILETADPFLPVWVALCIPVVGLFEGAARSVCGVAGILVRLMTFDLKGLHAAATRIRR